jgi:starch phosphorylase
MAILALRTSDAANGVSKLHGEVSRSMWEGVWPGVPNEEVPIRHVTNGIHARSWLSPEMTRLFDKHLSETWLHNPEDQSVWEAIDKIPNEEIWDIRQDRRQRLVKWVRKRLRRQLERRGASSNELAAADHALDPEALTIGFARRFATYKRANLLFRDPERIHNILRNSDRPVQIVLAGKAHPADTQGKELIRQIIHFARQGGEQFRNIVFLENYDIHVARYLVSGVDVWLNTPRRGMEASGTSGMKAALNGVLNLSVLDGWWDEAWQKDLGWAIGSGEVYGDYDYQDQVESEDLYDLLEKQVVPTFYEREDGLPQRWLEFVKNCLHELSPMFNTNRMVREYADHFYMPSHDRAREMMGDDLSAARDLNAYKQRLRASWDAIKVESIEADVAEPLGVHEPLKVSAEVTLGDLGPDDVRVQCYCGPMDAHGNITEGASEDLSCDEDLGSGRFRFSGEMEVINSGQHGFAVRIVPGHEKMASLFEPGLIVWDEAATPARSDEEPVAASPA